MRSAVMLRVTDKPAMAHIKGHSGHSSIINISQLLLDVTSTFQKDYSYLVEDITK